MKRRLGIWENYVMLGRETLRTPNDKDERNSIFDISTSGSSINAVLLLGLS